MILFQQIAVIFQTNLFLAFILPHSSILSIFFCSSFSVVYSSRPTIIQIIDKLLRFNILVNLIDFLLNINYIEESL